MVDKNKTVRSILSYEKPICLLNNFKDGMNMSDIREMIQSTWGHTSIVVNKLIDSGILKKEKIGRDAKLNITNKGKAIAKEIKKFVVACESV